MKKAETHWASCRCPSLSEGQGWRNKLGAVGWCHWGDKFSGACVGAWRPAWRRRGCHTSPESRLSAAATSASAPTTRHGPTNHVGSLWRTDPKQLSLFLLLSPDVCIHAFFFIVLMVYLQQQSKENVNIKASSVHFSPLRKRIRQREAHSDTYVFSPPASRWPLQHAGRRPH